MEKHLYFKQLLSGVDVGTADVSARQMANFIYLIGDRSTGECVVIDPAWDIDGILNVAAEDEMKEILIKKRSTMLRPRPRR